MDQKTIEVLAEKLGIAASEIRTSLIPELVHRETMTLMYAIVVSTALVVVATIIAVKDRQKHRGEDEMSVGGLFAATVSVVMSLTVFVGFIPELIRWTTAPTMTAVQYLINMAF